MNYIQHFSDRSEQYLNYRPQYPKELFIFFKSKTYEQDLAWDCGTGNGQAAVALAQYFTKVIATDINQAQLDQALMADNIQYCCYPAEKTNIPTSSVDLVTVAQALHWFDLDPFYQEVKRVLKPKGIIAAWCYSLGYITPEVDVVVRKLYHQLPWPKERNYIEEKYETIPFPFNKLNVPSFVAQKSLTLEQLLGYLNTWSAVKERIQQKGVNPIDEYLLELKKAWGDPYMSYMMRWPLHLLIGTCAL